MLPLRNHTQKCWPLLALLFCAFSHAEEIGQNTSFQTTDITNRKASDTSLQHSTSYAMTALMDLGNLNIPSAVNNGMTAYGKYRNSETLDKLGDQNLLRAGSLSTAGSDGGPVVKKTDTTFRRLDPGFLRQGKFHEVASEFEKRSGMKREQFLNQLSEISEKKIRKSDPQLVDKVISRFENFVAKIPNKDFRANLEKGIAMVPESVRTGIISKAVQKFASPATGAPGGSIPEAAVAKKEDAPAAAFPAEPGTDSAPEQPTQDVQAAAPPARTPASSDEDPKNPLGNIIQSAIDTQESGATIFQQVSKKYRTLTPTLLN